MLLNTSFIKFGNSQPLKPIVVDKPSDENKKIKIETTKVETVKDDNKTEKHKSGEGKINYLA